MEEKKKFYIVYQITNKLNDNIYIGVHMTYNINDKYFGSGSNIRKAIKEFGKENFQKIILYNFDSKEEMLEKERELVNEEFVKRGDTYNLHLGGGEFKTENLVTVKDKNGNTFDVHKTDPRYLSGDVVHVSVGIVTVKDDNNICFSVSINDPRYLSGELKHNCKNKATVKDNNGKVIIVDIDDERLLNGELVGLTKGLIAVKDMYNNISHVSINDPRYLSGELIPIWSGKKHKLETHILK